MVEKKYTGVLYWANGSGAGVLLYSENERGKFEKDRENLVNNLNYVPGLESCNRSFLRLPTWTHVQDFSDNPISKEGIVRSMKSEPKADEDFSSFLELLEKLPDL